MRRDLHLSLVLLLTRHCHVLSSISWLGFLIRVTFTAFGWPLICHIHVLVMITSVFFCIVLIRRWFPDRRCVATRGLFGSSHLWCFYEQKITQHVRDTMEDEHQEKMEAAMDLEQALIAPLRFCRKTGLPYIPERRKYVCVWNTAKWLCESLYRDGVKITRSDAITLQEIVKRYRLLHGYGGMRALHKVDWSAEDMLEVNEGFKCLFPECGYIGKAQMMFFHNRKCHDCAPEAVAVSFKRVFKDLNVEVPLPEVTSFDEIDLGDGHSISVDEHIPLPFCSKCKVYIPIDIKLRPVPCVARHLEKHGIKNQSYPLIVQTIRLWRAMERDGITVDDIDWACDVRIPSEKRVVCVICNNFSSPVGGTHSITEHVLRVHNTAYNTKTVMGKRPFGTLQVMPIGSTEDEDDRSPSAAK